MLNRILCFALVAGTATTCFGQFISYGNTYNSSPAYTSYYSTPPAYSGPFTVYKSGRRADYVFHGYIYPVYPDHTGSVGHRRLPGQWWDGAHYPASTLPPYLSYGQVDHSHRPWSVIPGEGYVGATIPKVKKKPKKTSTNRANPTAPPTPRGLLPSLSAPETDDAPMSKDEPKQQPPADPKENPEFRAQNTPMPR